MSFFHTPLYFILIILIILVHIVMIIILSDYLRHHKNGWWSAMAKEDSSQTLEQRLKERLEEKESEIAMLKETLAAKEKAISDMQFRSGLMEGIFRSSVDAIFITDVDGGFIDVNDSALSLFGYSNREDIMSWSAIEAYKDPSDRECFRKVIEKSGSVKEYPLQLRRADRTVMDCTVTATVWRKHDMTIGGYSGIIRDITEQKKLVKELAESEEKFRTIANIAQDAIIMIDSHGKVIYWNNAAENIFGYSADYISGMVLHHVLAPERYNEKYASGFSLFKQTGKGSAVGKTLELEANRKDGVRIPIELSLSAIKRDDGWYAVGIVRDITDRKISERIVSEEYARRDQWFNENIFGIYETTLDGKILNVNNAFVSMLGYGSPDEIKNISAFELYFREKDRNDYLDKLVKKGHLPSILLNLKKKDGTVFPTNCMSYLTEGVIRGFISPSTIKQNSFIIPICSFCRMAREPGTDNSWVNIETYIVKYKHEIYAHPDFDFSHSICPACASKHYPGIHLR
ncbi:PAS domain S-box protein [Candidatus Woesearchaeota archaeon]|nr:PAS domain S-box protein [Candidatus Woesearchaeota archaeon]